MELTEERTEIQATLTNMQDSFTKRIQSIKDASEAKARLAETRIQEAEKTYIAAQETILKDFTTLTQNYNNILEAFSNLGNDVRMSQIKQDRCHLGMQQTIGSMMQILVGIHQNLANGTSPEFLLQEHVNHLLMQSTFEADDGNGAPGNVITESSSTTQQESGRKK
jgi:phage-related protein